MPQDHRYWVYMVTSSSRRALYIGVTNNLEKRVWQHQNGTFGGFSSQYRTSRRERFDDIRSAINREKQLKGWTRTKKGGAHSSRESVVERLE